MNKYEIEKLMNSNCDRISFESGSGKSDVCFTKAKTGHDVTMHRADCLRQQNYLYYSVTGVCDSLLSNSSCVFVGPKSSAKGGGNAQITNQTSRQCAGRVDPGLICCGL